MSYNGRRQWGASRGSWNRSITSISRCAAAGETNRKEINGAGPKIVEFGQSDGSTVAVVAKLIVVRALGPRNAVGIVATGDWLDVFLVIYSRKHVVVANHSARAVLNLERRHAILSSEFFDCSDN